MWQVASNLRAAAAALPCIVPALALIVLLAIPSPGEAQAPAVRVQLPLNPENWDTPDPGLAISGSGTAGELGPAQAEDRLRATMSEGALADAYRRRRAYPVLDLAERDIRRGDPGAAISEYEKLWGSREGGHHPASPH